MSFKPTHRSLIEYPSWLRIGTHLQRLGTKWYITEFGHTAILEDFEVIKLKEYKPKTNMLLPTGPQERKNIPITTGFLDYFPLAVAEVAKCSKAGNDQHHPGEPLFWDKTKSTDHADCIARHLVDRGKFDTDGQRHSAKLAWRALALLQIELENEKEKS